MFGNYLKTAFRNLWRDRKFSAINVVGLAIGMATCLLMILYIHHELSYDRYNKKADRIVRVVFKGSVGGQPIKEANVMPPVARTLQSNYPEVQQATRLVNGGAPIIGYGDKSFKQEAFAYVDSNFFQVFTLPFVEGDVRTALLQPHTIVITRAIARQYFGNQDPIGKLLDFKDWNTSFKVTGVIDKVPDNSHFHFNFFASMASWPDAKSASFMTSGYYTYLVLPKGYDYRKLQAKLPGIVDKYIGPQMQKAMGTGLSAFRKNGNNIGLYLQPLTAIHLHSDFTGDLSPGSNVSYIYIFGVIGIFMLLIACINFMNLSTASASRRAREIGIRKVLGSGRPALVKQFLLESLLVTVIAFLIALVMVSLALPLFNGLSGKALSLNVVFLNTWMMPGILLFVLCTGLLSGSYPAFFLSSYKPVSVLKGQVSSGKKSMGLRSGLVVFQFFISITLIVCTVVVYRQLRYMQHMKLGYDKNQVLILPETWLLGKTQEAFHQQLLQDPRIEEVSVSGYLPAGSSYGNSFYVYGDGHANRLVKTLRYDVDTRYIATMGMKLASGRNFSKDFGTDSTAIIVNQTAAKAFGWGNDALGHTITRRDNDGTLTTYRVIGVVKDFHFRSLHELISPLVMVLGHGAGTMILKVKAGNTRALLTDIRKKWDQLTPEAPLSYSFLDDRVSHTYVSEQQTGRILGIFSGLAIFIACLGLFGLVMYAARRRTREIGIRKVLGAGVPGIVGLLTKDFIRLVVMAFIMAAPVAWWAMHTWLQDFAYRIRISWWIFLLAGVVAMVIALATVGLQAVKAAMANPVKSLRTE
ncbi:MAG TPA: ABC transporter permease [Chitinophagaceae bacterium]|nr:ABC transporter permease [Chitinophagaceae bacterium]